MQYVIITIRVTLSFNCLSLKTTIEIDRNLRYSFNYNNNQSNTYISPINIKLYTLNRYLSFIYYIILMTLACNLCSA